MASIQCAIELYDGVSPVLESMSTALDGMAGKFTAFGEEMSGINADTAGLEALSAAMESLAGSAGVASGALAGTLAVAISLRDVLSEDMFTPLITGAELTVESIEQIVLAAQSCAAELGPVFVPAGEEIHAVFETMRANVESTLTGLGSFISGFASGLPGYFSGPLNQISGMFEAMAASARASVASIISSASAAASAVSAAASSAESAGVRLSSVSPVEGGGEYVFTGVDASNGLLAENGDGIFVDLPEPERYYRQESVTQLAAPQVEVTVNNENHFSSETDVELVLRELERRLADAVASGMEGVFA